MAKVTQYSGIRRVKSKKETIMVDGIWTIDIPEKCTYCADTLALVFGFEAESYRDDGKSMNVPFDFQNPPVLMISDGATYAVTFYGKTTVLESECYDTREVMSPAAYREMGFNVLLSTDECSIAYNENNIILSVRGVNGPYMGSIMTVPTFYQPKPMENIVALLKTVRILPKNEQITTGNVLTKEMKALLPLTITDYVDVTPNISVPVYQGCSYAKNGTAHDGRVRPFIMVPKEYPLIKDPMDAPIGVSFVQVMPFSNENLNKVNSGQLITILQKCNVFNESRVFVVRKTDVDCIMFQIAGFSTGWCKANFAVSIKDKIALGCTIINYSDSKARSASTIDLIHFTSAFLDGIRVR